MPTIPIDATVLSLIDRANRLCLLHAIDLPPNLVERLLDLTSSIHLALQEAREDAQGVGMPAGCGPWSAAQLQQAIATSVTQLSAASRERFLQLHPDAA